MRSGRNGPVELHYSVTRLQHLRQIRTPGHFSGINLQSRRRIVEARNAERRRVARPIECMKRGPCPLCPNSGHVRCSYECLLRAKSGLPVIRFLEEK
jgi:hypothetical protein